MSAYKFIEEIEKVKDTEEVLGLFRCYVSQIDNNIDKRKIKHFISDIKDENISTFGNSIGVCLKQCSLEKPNAEKYGNKNYLLQLNEFEKFLTTVSDIIKEIVLQRKGSSTQEKQSSTLTAIEQNKDVLAELNDRIGKTKEDIEQLDKEVKNSNRIIDDKIFSLIINTVAILGIFVAIAFTGFSVTSILSNIDVATTIGSEEAFMKLIFFLLVAALLSYNLLLLLVYFIFQLSRPIMLNKNTLIHNRPGVVFNSFKTNVTLKLFLWIDGIMALLAIALFICIVLIW